MSVRTGIGYDVHRLVAGRRLVIGGVDVEFELGQVLAFLAHVIDDRVAIDVAGPNRPAARQPRNGGARECGRARRLLARRIAEPHHQIRR